MLDPVLYRTSEEIPEYARLEAHLRTWLGDERRDLQDIFERIHEHMADYVDVPFDENGDDVEYDDKYIQALNEAHGDANHIAIRAFDELIQELEVNSINKWRLQKLVAYWHHYTAYDRLLTDFRELLTLDEESALVAEAREIFVPEALLYWGEEFTRGSDIASILLQGIITPLATTEEGKLIKALAVPWRMIVETLKDRWEQAYQIPPDRWEELIAAAFDRAGYDEVVLTPRSGDHGRDVIAIKKGVGSMRIIGSVKAYKPGHLVNYDDIRALLGVLHGDQQASKGIITTTSDFPRKLMQDPYIKPFLPYRLELLNGPALQKWLQSLLTRP